MHIRKMHSVEGVVIEGLGLQDTELRGRYGSQLELSCTATCRKLRRSSYGRRSSYRMGRRRSGWVLSMGRIVLAAFAWHPFVVLFAYAGLIVDYYRRYLDGDLKHIRPQIPAAPEDILGFGFWVVWAIAAIWFAAACILSYRLARQRRVAYWLPLLCAFSLLSATDFWLYGVLERQVLEG